MQMEREYRAFRHSRLAKPTLIFAIIGTLGYAPWWFIMVLPVYRYAAARKLEAIWARPQR